MSPTQFLIQTGLRNDERAHEKPAKTLKQ